jgi:hypothetical protein
MQTVDYSYTERTGSIIFGRVRGRSRRFHRLANLTLRRCYAIARCPGKRQCCGKSTADVIGPLSDEGQRSMLAQDIETLEPVLSNCINTLRAHQYNRGTNRTRLFAWSTTTTRFRFGSTATENCWEPPRGRTACTCGFKQEAPPEAGGHT